MLCVAGTVPDPAFGLRSGSVRLVGEGLAFDGTHLDVQRGTPALLAAASRTAEALGQPAPFAFLAGDVGTGQGSRRLYAHLTEALSRRAFTALTFHYMMPLVQGHRRLQEALSALDPRPLLIADAGFMYVAKMSGAAAFYDLFTPDVGELAFLADEEAPHPFYTRGFILHEENRVPDLITRAYAHRNAARYLLVKGERDILADEGGLLASVSEPSEEALEAIGGTGDTVTGIVSSLIAAGWPIREAALIAMRTNRLAGRRARPTPATPVREIIRCIPEALEEALAEETTP